MSETTDTTTAATPAAATQSTTAAAATTTATPVEIVYDLKLPNQSALDSAALERTAAFARPLGLSPDVAQKALEFTASEAGTVAAAAREKALVEFRASLEPNGAEWQRQITEHNAAALKDAELGNGDPKKLEQAQFKATRVLATFGSPALAAMLKSDPVGSHPEIMKFLMRVAGAMKEDTLVTAGPVTPKGKSTEELFYPDMVAGRT